MTDPTPTVGAPKTTHEHEVEGETLTADGSRAECPWCGPTAGAPKTRWQERSNGWQQATTEPRAPERVRAFHIDNDPRGGYLVYVDGYEPSHVDDATDALILARAKAASPSESSDLLAAVEALPGSATFGETWINRRATLDLIRESRSAPASRSWHADMTPIDHGDGRVCWHRNDRLLSAEASREAGLDAERLTRALATIRARGEAFALSGQHVHWTDAEIAAFIIEEYRLAATSPVSEQDPA